MHNTLHKPKTKFISIKAKCDFLAFKQNSKVFRSNSFLVKLKNNNLSCIRFGFIIKKSFGNAVARNKVRRRIKSLMRKYLSEICICTDMLFLLNSNAESISFNELEIEFSKFANFLINKHQANSNL